MPCPSRSTRDFAERRIIPTCLSCKVYDMKLLQPDILPNHFAMMDEIEADMKTIYRMLVFTPELQASTFYNVL